ncbi:protein SPMIP2 isoform X2 [Mixophyes fleayi]|uniref:protein SPMIP2 isoform X2 n=1 Tax=Mixophyes fleayi TaxID=3061075 RepID=UPI003F4E11B0
MTDYTNPSGPDYVRDYRAKLPDCTRYIGEGMSSAESTSEVDYLCRAAPSTPAPLPKDCYVGGIGWGVSAFTMLNRNQLYSGHQIKIGEFRQASEEKVTHQYQNPWHPLPPILDAQGFGSRATLAWTQDRYDDYFYTKGRWTSLLD